MEKLYPWLWIAAIAVIFWLLIIRPAARRQKEMSALQAALTTGDDVILTSGVFATIVGVSDDHLEVEIAPGVAIRIVRGAVASVRRDDPVDSTTEGTVDLTKPVADDVADVVPHSDTEER